MSKSVPSDIEISRAATPKPITRVANYLLAGFEACASGPDVPAHQACDDD